MIDDGTLRRLDLLRSLAARPGTEAEGLAAEAAITRIMRRHGLSTRCLGDFWRGYRADCEAHVSKLHITCVEFRLMPRNTLVGFAMIRIAEMRMVIHDVAIHRKGDARWAQLPSKPMLGKDGAVLRDQTTGKIAYATIIELDDRATRDAFSAAVVAAVLERDAAAFEAVT